MLHQPLFKYIHFICTLYFFFSHKAKSLSMMLNLMNAVRSNLCLRKKDFKKLIRGALSAKELGVVKIINLFTVTFTFIAFIRQKSLFGVTYISASKIQKKYADCFCGNKTKKQWTNPSTFL